jgi:hypothetical protein
MEVVEGEVVEASTPLFLAPQPQVSISSIFKSCIDFRPADRAGPRGDDDDDEAER